MKTVNYSVFRKNLKSFCDEVADKNETVVLCRKADKNVVILSLEQYNKYLEVLEHSTASRLSGLG